MNCLVISLFALGIPILAGSVSEVHNGRVPQGTPITLELAKDLVITPEGRDDHFIWAGNNIAVDVDRRGHMYVTDPDENRIVVLDPGGNFVRQIGREGQGPGEFQSLITFQFLADGSALAFENLGAQSSISHYDRDLDFVERKKITGVGRFLRSAVFSPDGRWLATTATQIDAERSVEITEFLIVDREYRVREKLLHWETMSFNPAKVQDKEHWVEFLSQRFWGFTKGNNAYAAFDAKGNVYTAKATAYEVTKWSAGMEKQMVITREYKPIPQTEDQIEAVVEPVRAALLAQLPTQLQTIITPVLIKRAVDRAGFPPVKFPISGLKTMEDGTLLVLHDYNNVTRVGVADLFDEQGAYLGSYRHPDNGLNRMVFKNGFAYTIETREDEENVLVRYRLSEFDG